MNLAASSIVYKFGKNNFLAFIIAEIFGWGMLILTFTPNFGGVYTIYFPTVLVIPCGIFGGFYFLYKSLRTPFCSRCNFELKYESKAFPYEKHQELMKSLESRNTISLPSTPSVPFSSQPRTEIDFAYCPGCVSIGKVLLLTVDSKKEKKNETFIEGNFVREWKEGLRFN